MEDVVAGSGAERSWINSTAFASAAASTSVCQAVEPRPYPTAPPVNAVSSHIPVMNVLVWGDTSISVSALRPSERKSGLPTLNAVPASGVASVLSATGTLASLGISVDPTPVSR